MSSGQCKGVYGCYLPSCGDELGDGNTELVVVGVMGGVGIIDVMVKGTFGKAGLRGPMEVSCDVVDVVMVVVV